MNLQTRVTNILTRPKDEWPVVAAEPATIPELFSSYIALLAAIPAVCQIIGMSLIGVSVPLLGRFRLGLGRSLVSGILSYVLTLVMCYVSAVVIEKLAPTFESKGDTVQALKLVAYAYTPVWLAGVLNLIPVLTPLIFIAGLYAIYLFYLGLTPVMQTRSDKVIPYMLVSAIVIIVLGIVVGLIAGVVSRPAIGPTL